MILMIIMMGYYDWKGANFHMTWTITLFPLLVLLMALFMASIEVNIPTKAVIPIAIMAAVITARNL